MPKSRSPFQPGRRTCSNQVALLMPVTRDASGRFTRWFTGMPFTFVAFRRDTRGRFATLAARHLNAGSLGRV